MDIQPTYFYGHICLLTRLGGDQTTNYTVKLFYRNELVPIRRTVLVRNDCLVAGCHCSRRFAKCNCSQAY